MYCVYSPAQYRTHRTLSSYHTTWTWNKTSLLKKEQSISITCPTNSEELLSETFKKELMSGCKRDNRKTIPQRPSYLTNQTIGYAEVRYEGFFCMSIMIVYCTSTTVLTLVSKRRCLQHVSFFEGDTLQTTAGKPGWASVGEGIQVDCSELLLSTAGAHCGTAECAEPCPKL